MPFPMLKLGYLAFRQLSKPINHWIQVSAKSNPLLRKYICIPPAQLYHWYDTKFTKSSLNLKMGKFTPIKDDEAVQLGAEIIAEFIIFGICVGVVTYEWYTSYIKQQTKEQKLEERFIKLERKGRELDIETDQMDCRLRHVERVFEGAESGLISSLADKLGGLVTTHKSESEDSKSTPKSVADRLDHVEKRQLQLLVSLDGLDQRLIDLKENVEQLKPKPNLINTLATPEKKK